MITEAEIQSIDYASNSCVVRIPFFETLNTTQDIVLPSRFAIQPGIYSGYKVGDVVWVAFEDGQAENPIIIGKVFKGTTNESDCGGAISCSNLAISKTATIPDSTIIQTSDSNFDSIKKIIEKIKNIQLVNGIEGMLGGSLTSPLIIKDGDSAKASKIVLSNNDAGQITNNSTATLFGFLTENTNILTVGSKVYKTNIRGSEAHPTYNDDNLVLMSDISYQASTESASTENAIGTWITGKTIYRKAFRYTGDMAAYTDIEVGSIGTNIGDVVDIRQTITHTPSGSSNKFVYNTSIIQSTSTYILVSCRVDLSTGKVYARSTFTNLSDTTLIVIVEYTKE